MPNPVAAAFSQLFPPRREQIQNPYRRSLTQAADAAMGFYRRHPAIGETLLGRPIPAEMQPAPPSPYGQIVGQTVRGRLADIVNRAIPGPVHVALQAVGDPMQAIEQPLGPGQAIFGARRAAKEMGLVTKSMIGESGLNLIRVEHPGWRGRMIEEHGKTLGELVDASRGWDAVHWPGDIVAQVDYLKHGNLSPQGRDMFKMETSLGLKEPVPTYKVGFAGTTEYYDPKLKKVVSADAAYGNEMFEQLLKEGAKDVPKGKIYAVEAYLVNQDLMRVADKFGLFGPRLGYGTDAVFFARDGRLVPLHQVMKQLGTPVGRTGAVPVTEQADWYKRAKKAQMQRERQQALEFQEAQRRGFQPEGRVREPWPEGEMPSSGIIDEYEGMMGPPEDIPEDTQFSEAYDRATTMMRAGTSPGAVHRQLQNEGFDEDVINDLADILGFYPTRR